MFVAQTRSAVKDPTVMLFQPPMDLRSRLRRRVRSERILRSLARYQASRPTGYEAFSDDRTPYGADVLPQLPSGDVINLHAMYEFIDYRAFFAAVPQHTPVVRTLHDMGSEAGRATDAVRVSVLLTHQFTGSPYPRGPRGMGAS